MATYRIQQITRTEFQLQKKTLFGWKSWYKHSEEWSSYGISGIGYSLKDCEQDLEKVLKDEQFRQKTVLIAKTGPVAQG